MKHGAVTAGRSYSPFFIKEELSKLLSQIPSMNFEFTLRTETCAIIYLKEKSMNESDQILFMQIRLLRMMAERSGLSLKQAARTFDTYNVLPFIRKNFGIFHIEGDEAVFEEVKEFLKAEGATL